ncbi:MAG: Glu-tRNA(Gln) amidotransferase subunit GatE [Nanoarchaeota archaeon]
METETNTLQFKKIKCGLEIHQQLNTHKLFCNCPSVLRNDTPEFEIKRKLHAVAGESGEVDVAAQFEAGQDREFIYQGYDTTCLVELDECPPYLINQEALQIALHISLFLNCEIIPITQIMRKTVVDGSNTSGFQRTLLVARNGYVDTSFGRVRIDSIGLEEDAARIVEKRGKEKVYNLDRLGIPLIEISTAPDITSAEQCKEVALYLGDVLRSCKVKRGIGTIRQDVNISIENHQRVEIKGFQDVKMFVPTIEKEVIRQLENVRTKKNLKSEVRNANVDGTTLFLRPMPGASRMYPETDLPLLKISKQIIDEAKRTLPKSREEIRKELTKKGLSEEQIKILLKEEKLEEFEILLKILEEPKTIFKLLIEIPKEVSSHEGIENIEGFIDIEKLEKLAELLKEKKIEINDVKYIFVNLIKGIAFENAIKVEKTDLGEIEQEIAKLVKEKPGLTVGGYMGLIMTKFKGKVNGKEAGEILKKLINK